MTDSKTSKPQATDTKPSTATTDPKTLSPADLDQISGGINPQPLPPGKNRASQ